MFVSLCEEATTEEMNLEVDVSGMLHDESGMSLTSFDMSHDADDMQPHRRFWGIL
jgi:hypothetical protein